MNPNDQEISAKLKELETPASTDGAKTDAQSPAHTVPMLSDVGVYSSGDK